MEISLLIRRVEFLEARAEAIDTLRQRISTCTSQLAYFQMEAPTEGLRQPTICRQ